MTTNGQDDPRLARTIALARDMSHLDAPADVAQHCTRLLEQRAPTYRLFRLTPADDGRTPARIERLPSLADAATPPEGGSSGAVESELVSKLLGHGEVSIFDALEPARDAGWEALGRPRSLAAIPVFRSGELAYLVVLASPRPRDLPPRLLDELTWQLNLHAQATRSAREVAALQEAHAKLDLGLEYIARLQRRILPDEIPRLSGVRVEVRSKPSERSGGDFYDFFFLPDGRWAVLLADVCGHGTATAVLMAITHAFTRLTRPFVRPDTFLAFLDRQLFARYTAGTGAFVVAGVFVYEPHTRVLTFSLAGLPSPRLVQAGGILHLNRARGPGLGLLPKSRYTSARQTVAPGDQLVLFTDGVTDALSPRGEFYGEDRLDAQLAAVGRGDGVADAIETSVAAFADNRPEQDDRTLLTLHFD